MKLICTDGGCECGSVGTPTPLKDKNGEPLEVGDVVLLKNKLSAWSKLRFVAYDTLHDRYYIIGDYLDSGIYDIELAIGNEVLSEGFGIGNVYYKEDVIL